MADRKMPWIKFWASDWMMDQSLSLCSPATRGIWMDLLCVMHSSGRTGEVSGTVEQLARMSRCTPDEMRAALRELGQTVTAESRESHGVVTVINRRMSREHKERLDSNLRQQRKRGHTLVTPESQPCHATEAEAEAEAEAKNTVPLSLNPPTSHTDSGLGSGQTDQTSEQDKKTQDLVEYLLSTVTEFPDGTGRQITMAQIAGYIRRGLTPQKAYSAVARWHAALKTPGLVQNPIGWACREIEKELDADARADRGLARASTYARGAR